MAGQPKPVFYIAVALVVVALIVFAVYQARDLIAPQGNGNQAANKGDKIDPGKLESGKLRDYGVHSS